MDIKGRIANDEQLADMYTQEAAKVFYENYLLLSSIFNAKGMFFNETSLELSKEEFINIINEAGLFQDPEEEKKGSDGQVLRRFDA